MLINGKWLLDKGFTKLNSSYSKYYGDIEGNYHMIGVVFDDDKIHVYVRQQYKHGYKLHANIITYPKIKSTLAIEYMWVLITGNKL